MRFDPLEQRQMLAVTPVLVADLTAGSAGTSIGNVVGVGDTAYFTGSGYLWKSDGSAAGTTQVFSRNVQGSSQTSYPAAIGSLSSTPGKLYFHASYQIPGAAAFANELYGSDGTSGGTNLIDTVITRPGPQFAEIADEVGGFYYSTNTSFDFSGPDFTTLFRTTGTSASTVQLVRGDTDDQVTLIGPIGNQMLFNFFDQSAGTTTLWRTDGTSSGTIKISDTAATAFNSTNNGTTINGVLYYTADTSATGLELWRSDGTSAGTRLVADINPGTGGSSPQLFTKLGNTLYFRANDGTSGASLWKSDGTSSGTVLVANVNPATLLGSTNSSITTLFFTADDGVRGLELWKSDGTSSGTQLVRDINPTGSSSAANLVLVGNRMYFSANDGTNGNELWTSDGTSTGTAMVSNLNPNAASSNPSSLANVNGTLFFTADNGTVGRELWRVAPEVITTNGTTLIVTGGPEANRVDLVFTSPTTYELTVDNGPRQTFNTSQYNTFQFNLGGGNDLANIHLSSIADDAVFSGLTGSITSSNYAISFSGVETKYVFGDALDKVVFNDAGAQEAAYLLSSYGATFDEAHTYLNQAIGFGSYTAQATGSNDRLHIYGNGDGGFYSSPTSTRFSAGNLQLFGQGYRTVITTSLNTNDNVYYTGSAAAELFTSLEAFSVIASTETTQYFVASMRVYVTGGGGNDMAVMYDTIYNDTFGVGPSTLPQSSKIDASFVGPNMQRIAYDYAQVYAWSYFGGLDAATIDVAPLATSLNWYGNSSFVYGGGGGLVVQVLQYGSVNLRNSGAVSNAILLDDSTGNDVFSIASQSARLTYPSGVRSVSMEGAWSVVARGINGGVNRRGTPVAGQTVQVTYVGSWV